jgi:hypothetical protein
MRTVLPIMLIGIAMNACSGVSDTGTDPSPWKSPDGPPMPSTSAESAEAAVGEPATLVQESVLAEIEVDDQRITFIQWGSGDDALLALKVRGSAERGNALDELYARQGELTLLEIFQALAPEGSVPPPALVAAHADQAQALGRADKGVRAIEKSVFNPPAGTSACAEALTFPPPIVWNPKFLGAPFGGTNYFCTGSPLQSGTSTPTSTSCTHLSTQRQRVGVCKASAGTDVIATYFAGFAGQWVQVGSNDTVHSGQYAFIEFLAQSSPYRAAVLGTSGATNGYGIRAGTGG